MKLNLSEITLKSPNIKGSEQFMLIGLLVFNFIISFRLTNSTVLHDIGKMTETLYLVLLFLYISSRVINRLVKGNLKLNGFEFMFCIYLALPILPAVSAYFVWDQPFYLGFLSFREFYLMGGALVLYNFVKDNVKKLIVVEKSMVITAWIALTLFYLTSLFADPTQFLDSKVVSFSANRGGILLFKFNMGFVFFGSIYYFVRTLKKGGLINLVCFAMFIIYIFFFRQDRSSMLAVAAALGLFALFHLDFQRKILVSSILSVISICAIVLIYHLNPESIEAYVFMFEDILYALSGESNPNVGMSVRIYETAIANTYVQENPLLGNGKISNYFMEGGFNALFYFFYPTDIGLIGSVFTYGIPGTILLYSQFIFVVYWIRKIKYFKENVFFLATSYYLLILFIDSMSNGYLTLFSSQSISTVAIIFMFYMYDKAIVKEVRSRFTKDYNFDIATKLLGKTSHSV
ncbi:MAG: O-antigen ligase family protein [Bacteroidota bacterium]